MEHNLTMSEITSNYLSNAPTFANALVYLLAVVRPPRRLFEYLLKFVKPFSEKQTLYPTFFFICRLLWLIKRGLGHILYMDFSIVPGRMGWVFWKLGIIKFWNKVVLKHGPVQARPSKTEYKDYLKAT